MAATAHTAGAKNFNTSDTPSITLPTITVWSILKGSLPAGIAAVFNGADHLADCLESVRTQTYPSREHVVIDGASTDGSVDEIRARADGLAHWVSEPDGGVY